MKRLLPPQFPRARAWLDHNGALISFLLVIALGIWGLHELRAQTARTTEATAQATKAICNIRGFYRHQANQSQDFLDKHPGKLPDFLTKLGVTRASIERDIRNNQARVRALGVVVCPPDIP